MILKQHCGIGQSYVALKVSSSQEEERTGSNLWDRLTRPELNVIIVISSCADAREEEHVDSAIPTLKSDMSLEEERVRDRNERVTRSTDDSLLVFSTDTDTAALS